MNAAEMVEKRIAFLTTLNENIGNGYIDNIYDRYYYEGRLQQIRQEIEFLTKLLKTLEKTSTAS